MTNVTNIRGGRISYIDALKGFLILLVIIGHSDVNVILPRATQAIYTFHMPLFFILSGFFLHRQENVRMHLKKSAKAYLLPYCFTCLIGMLLICGKYVLTSDMKYHGILEDYLARVMFVQIAQTTDVGPIWFLVALFWGQNILTALINLTSKFQLCIVVLAIAAITLLLTEKLFVPFSIFQGFTALPYLLVGFLLKEHWDDVIRIAKDRICIFSIIALWAVYVLLGKVMRISFVDLPQGCTSYLVSILISLVILQYASYIDYSFFRRIGKHTLLILCVHTLVLPYVSRIGSITHNVAFVSLEIAADILVTLLISYVFVKTKSIVKYGNTSKRA